VQGDRDIMVITEARGKPLDPSLKPTPPGVVPTTAKVGIDATISEGIPKERFERISYAYADTAKVNDYLKGKADQQGKGGDDKEVAALAEKILALIAQAPVYYTDIAEHFKEYAFSTVARAIGYLHTTERLWQDERGRMCVRGSKFAAKPPT
jgi:2,5-furandicarboxylate decarboxylase 1